MNKHFKLILPDVIAVVAFVVLSLAYFFPAVLEGRVLAQHDAVAGIGSGIEMQEYQQRTGERTRWTNVLFGGMPTYQMAPSYDSTDLLKTVGDVYHLYLPGSVWLVFIMLLGFYILLRAFDLAFNCERSCIGKCMQFLNHCAQVCFSFTNRYFFTKLSAVCRKSSVFTVKPFYIFSEHIKCVNRISFSVQNQVCRIEVDENIIAFNFFNRTQQGDRRFLSGFK